MSECVHTHGADADAAMAVSCLDGGSWLQRSLPRKRTTFGQSQAPYL